MIVQHVKIVIAASDSVAAARKYLSLSLRAVASFPAITFSQLH